MVLFLEGSFCGVISENVVPSGPPSGTTAILDGDLCPVGEMKNLLSDKLDNYGYRVQHPGTQAETGPIGFIPGKYNRSVEMSVRSNSVAIMDSILLKICIATSLPELAGTPDAHHTSCRERGVDPSIWMRV